MSKERIKVLFIGGYARSGSTLLLRLLGQVEGFVATGELWDIWHRSLDENQLCGCGRPFWQCGFWQAVVAEAFGGHEQIDLEAIQGLRRSVQSNRHLPLLVLPFLRPARYREKLDAYADVMGRLYRGIHRVSEGRIIVDSSKVPPHAFLLRQVANVELHIVHLVRDSRATAHSWQRRKIRPEIHWQTTYMERYSPVRAAMEWNVMNGPLHLLQYQYASYMRLGYEELVEKPWQSILRIVAHVGEEAAGIRLFEDAPAVYLSIHHTVSGNPNRFQRGMVIVRPDIEWTEKMRQSHKRIVTALTWPLLLGYGYFKRRPDRFATGVETTQRQVTQVWTRSLWPIIIIASALGAGLVTLANVQSPLRPLLAFWFLLVCPGMAFVRLLGLEERLAEWTMAIALSLALNTIIATTMAYAGLWSPARGLVALIGISVSGALLQLITAYAQVRKAASF